MVLAIEMVQDKASRTPYPWQERRGLKVFQHGLERGALLRPLGSVVYFLPPYVITPEQIDFLAEGGQRRHRHRHPRRGQRGGQRLPRTTAIRAERRRPFVPRGAGSNARGRQ